MSFASRSRRRDRAPNASPTAPWRRRSISTTTPSSSPRSARDSSPSSSAGPRGPRARVRVGWLSRRRPSACRARRRRAAYFVDAAVNGHGEDSLLQTVPDGGCRRSPSCASSSVVPLRRGVCVLDAVRHPGVAASSSRRVARGVKSADAAETPTASGTAEDAETGTTETTVAEVVEDAETSFGKSPKPSLRLPSRRRRRRNRRRTRRSRRRRCPRRRCSSER